MFKLEDDDQEKTGSDATEEVEETKDDEIEDQGDDTEDDEDGGQGDDKTDWKARALKAEGILARKSKPKKPAAAPAPAAPVEAPDVNAAVTAALEARDLEDMDLPDELKTEVKKIAKVQNISVKKAAQDPYIQFRKSQIETKNEEEEASISRTPSGKPAGGDSKATPKFDMSTEEGRKAWDEYQKKNQK